MDPFDSPNSWPKPVADDGQERREVSEYRTESERSSSSVSSSRASFRSGPAINEDDIQHKDVLCGRERQIHAHQGNRKFRHLINMNRERYQTATSREVKTSITAEIVETVRLSGGRFLKQDEGIWREVDPNYAHEKVSHALRSAKDPNKPKQKRTRNVNIRPPSVEEEHFFQILAADQERIYQNLREKRADSRLF